MLDRRFSGEEYSVHFGANLHLGELVELEGYGLEPIAGSPAWPLAYPSRMGQRRSKNN
jgi:hypothetical protein